MIGLHLQLALRYQYHLDVDSVAAENNIRKPKRYLLLVSIDMLPVSPHKTYLVSVVIQ